MVSFQGYFMLIWGFSTTPLPTLAPNIRSNPLLHFDPANTGLMKNAAFTKYQHARLKMEAPILLLYQVLVYFERSVAGFIETSQRILKRNQSYRYISVQIGMLLPTSYCIPADPLPTTARSPTHIAGHPAKVHPSRLFGEPAFARASDR